MRQLTLTMNPTPAQKAKLTKLLGTPNKWVANRKISLVEKSEKPTRPYHLVHDCDHRPNGIIYRQPSCFDMPSTGSLPCGDYDHREVCEGQQAADVPSIQKIRLMVARENYRTPKVDVNLSPWEHGRAAAQAGKGEKACPYEILSPEYFEWLDGFEEYR